MRAQGSSELRYVRECGTGLLFLGNSRHTFRAATGKGRDYSHSDRASRPLFTPCLRFQVTSLGRLFRILLGARTPILNSATMLDLVCRCVHGVPASPAFLLLVEGHTRGHWVLRRTNWEPRIQLVYGRFVTLDGNAILLSLTWPVEQFQRLHATKSFQYGGIAQAPIFVLSG